MTSESPKDPQCQAPPTPATDDYLASVTIGERGPHND